MTQPNFALGINCKLFRNTGSYGAPVWSAVTGVSDFTVSPKWDFKEGSTRASRVKRGAKTLLGLEFKGKIKTDETDANYLAFLSALHGDAVLDVLAIDGNPTDPTITGTLQGYRFDAHVVEGEQPQGLDDVLFDSFELKPALSANPVCLVSAAVTAGSPVYTFTNI